MASAIEASGVADFVRRHVYFQTNLLHLLGLVLLLGAIGVVDLRTLGVARRVPIAELTRALSPFGVAGLGLMLASGALMFTADATALVASTVFQLKVALIALGIANAVAFHRLFGDLSGGAPAMAKVMAAASLAIWLGAGALGRLIGYV